MKPVNLEEERTQVARAYETAEQVLADYEAKIAGDFAAGDRKTEMAIRKVYRSRREQLQEAIQPQAGLFLKGRVDFADHPELRDDDESLNFAGRTYHVAIVPLGQSAAPRTLAWASDLADAFRAPDRFLDGEGVDAKVVFIGGHRRLDDVQPIAVRDGDGGLPRDAALVALLEARRGTDLHEVVATIEQEQFDLMKRPPDQNLVIQGGPGTGKTIIGLHRVGALLYRHAEMLDASDILVVTATDTLARYVRNVLPGLGHSQVQVLPISAMARHGAGTPVEESADRREALQRAAVKGDARMAEVIRNDLATAMRVVDDLGLAGTPVPREVIQQAVEDGRRRARSYRDQRRVVHDILRPVVDPSGAVDRVLVTAELDRVAPDRSARQLINDLLSSSQRLKSACEGIFTSAEQASLKRERRPLADAPWTVHDLPLLDVAHELIEGSLPTDETYMHIVVDEAQDLSPMQLRVLRRRLRSDGAVTVLGDLAQATTGWATSSWADHMRDGGFDLDADAYRTIATGYRVPAPQLEYANRLLQVMDIRSEPPVSILQSGDGPMLREVAGDSVEAGRDLVLEVVRSGQRGEAVAVIGPQGILDEVGEELERAGVRTAWNDPSEDVVSLITPADAKGLEFDHVVVLTPEAIYREDTITGPRTLYVALTRARGTLSLLHADRLPPALDPRAGASPVASDDTLPDNVASDVEGAEPTAKSAPIDTATLVDEAGGVLVAVRASQRLVVQRPGVGGAEATQLAEGYVLDAADGSVTAMLSLATGAVVTVTGSTLYALLAAVAAELPASR